MIDFTSQDTIKHSYSYDDINDEMTITFKDGADSELGSMKIEMDRFRPLMNALNTVAKVWSPDLVTTDKTKTNYKLKEKEGITEFA